MEKGYKTHTNSNSRSEEEREVDFEYKRCYVDKQGNYIDPKTTWDDLLKYYIHWWMLLGVGEGTRNISSSTPAKATKQINQEVKHKKNQKKATKLQSKDLATKEKKNKKMKKRKDYKLEAAYLKQTYNSQQRRYRS